MILGRKLFAHTLTIPSRVAPVLTILFVAFVIRLVCLAFLTEAINGEGAEYARIAENLVAGRGYVGIALEGRELMFPPLYPLLIAAGSFFTGDFYLAAQIVSLIAGVLLLLPLFGIARDLYGYKVAYAAIGIAALHPVLIQLSATTWVEGLYITLITASIYYLNRAQHLSGYRDWLLGGIVFGLAYLTCPQAILFPLLISLLLLVKNFKSLITIRNVIMFAGSFIALALPYIIFLSISTGGFRFEGKTVVNNELGGLVLSGVPYLQAGYEVTENLEEKGVWMRPNADVAKTSESTNYRATLRIVLSRGLKNLVIVFQDVASKPFFGAPLVFPLAILGLLGSPWTRLRARGEFVLLLVVVGSLLAMTTIIHHFSTRYYFVLIPFLILWASNGINELTRWAHETLVNLQVTTFSPGLGGQAAVGGLAFLGLASVFAIGAIVIFRSDREFGPISSAQRSAGEWLATLPGEKTIMDTATPTAFHAGAKYIPMPFCDSRTALRYAEKKNVNFIVVAGWEAGERPYLQEWLTAGIPGPNIALIYASGDQPQNRILIFRLNNSGVSEPVTTLPIQTKESNKAIADGPLSPYLANPRYFATPSGKPVYLTGAHTWANFQDRGPATPLPIFDFDDYLNFYEKNNLNFIRLWVWENARWAPWTKSDYFFDPLPYRRSGPGIALDGKAKFDLTQFNPKYFGRLRQHVQSAAERGVYVSVMLFNGFSIERKGYGLGNPWLGHPFNGRNNINGIDGDRNRNGEGEEVHTLLTPEILEIQEHYVKKVIDTVNDLDNVLFEISNESHSASQAWQYHMIKFIKHYEATQPKQHPVGMTSIWPNGNNLDLFSSPADWISPNRSATDFLHSPPPGDGKKVVMSDTDHLCGECDDRSWIWKSLTMGLNPIYMDGYKEKEKLGDPAVVDSRRNLGFARSYADRVNLARLLPMPKLCTSHYCLACLDKGNAEYLVYVPDGGAVTVDLSGAVGTLEAEWFDPSNGLAQNLGEVTGGGPQSFRVPFVGDAVLYLHGIQPSNKKADRQAQ